MMIQRYGVDIALSAAVLGVVYAAGWWVKEQGRAELRPEIERLQGELAAERADRLRYETAANQYRSEVDAVRRAAATHRVPVRLCVNAAPVPAEPAPRVDATPTPAGVSHEPPQPNLEAGPDIGPDLYALAADCDAEIAKLRALQGWISDDIR